MAEAVAPFLTPAIGACCRQLAMFILELLNLVLLLAYNMMDLNRTDVVCLLALSNLVGHN